MLNMNNASFSNRVDDKVSRRIQLDWPVIIFDKQGGGSNCCCQGTASGISRAAARRDLYWPLDGLLCQFLDQAGNPVNIFATNQIHHLYLLAEGIHFLAGHIP